MQCPMKKKTTKKPGVKKNPPLQINVENTDRLYLALTELFKGQDVTDVCAAIGTVISVSELAAKTAPREYLDIVSIYADHVRRLWKEGDKPNE